MSHVFFPICCPDCWEGPALHFPTAHAVSATATGPATGVVLHSHPVGVILLTVRGQVRITLKETTFAVPVSCATWMPAGTMHFVETTEGSECVCVAVNTTSPLYARLPVETSRVIVNVMTYEMIRHFARVTSDEIGEEQYEAIAKVIIGEIVAARPLPPTFAPIPEHPLLRHLVDEFAKTENLNRSNADWAVAVNMTERTLSRLIMRETGMTFKKWRIQICMLNSLPMVMEKMDNGTIAARLNYQRASTFIAVFKKTFGVTPGELRQRSRL